MIETPRLTIRPVTFDDDEFILALLNEPDFMENIGDKEVRSAADARVYMKEGPLACQHQHGFSLMTVSLKSGEQIGLCGLLKRDELKHPDLGYAFLSRHYRKGYAYEAAQQVLAHFRKIRPILATTSGSNFASQQLLLKLGFHQEVPTAQQKQQNTRTFILLASA